MLTFVTEIWCYTTMKERQILNIEKLYNHKKQTVQSQIMEKNI